VNWLFDIVLSGLRKASATVKLPCWYKLDRQRFGILDRIIGIVHYRKMRIIPSFHRFHRSAKVLLIEQTCDWGIKLFNDLQNYTEFRHVNWTYFSPTVLSCVCVHIACWHVTWPLWRCFEIAVLLMILIRYMYTYFIRDTTDKTDQRCDFETQLKCGKTDRTHQTECGVETELLVVGWEKCETDMKF